MPHKHSSNQKTPRHKPTSMHNHVRKMISMHRAGLLPQTPTAHQVTVEHDDWCDLLSGRGYCNCDPDIRLRWSYPQAMN